MQNEEKIHLQNVVSYFIFLNKTGLVSQAGFSMFFFAYHLLRGNGYVQS